MIPGVQQLKRYITRNPLLKDSFWAVWGNSIGYACFLLAGIIIARFLGKDLYGEYGLVKTTMFQIAGFATLGLGYTSTKFIAEYKKKNEAYLLSISRAALRTTFWVSAFLAIFFFFGAKPLAEFINEPTMKMPFRTLGIIIILRAIGTTQTGIISGYRDFKAIAHISIIAGVFMLVGSVPLTYFYGLKGSLSILLFSQILTVVLNFYYLKKIEASLSPQQITPFFKPLIKFSIPVAIIEFSFSFRYWFGLLLLAKFSSKGDVGLYTAAALWQSIILFVPNFLSNVILSHLSHLSSVPEQQHKTVNKMLVVNLISTILPLLCILVLSPVIEQMYGSTFKGLSTIIYILGLAAVFHCSSNVIISEMMAQNQVWALAFARCLRDVMIVTFVYIFLTNPPQFSASVIYATIESLCTCMFFMGIYIYYIYKIKKA